MAAPSLWEILDRACNTGPVMATKDFDMNIFSVATRLTKEYDIKYDPKTPVTTDDSLADDAWNAGLQLFTEVGAYCMNSSRIIKFDESEIKQGLLRKVEDNSPPSIICGGVIESNFPEGENFVKLYQSIAQEPLIDGFYVGPPLQSSEGRLVRSGTPLETHLGRSMVSWVPPPWLT
jgi:hypothetical protein